MQIGVATTGSAQTPAHPDTAITADFETFLRMLTTQIQNQDPLSPMQADEFASQLATFSMVEQQALTNTRLEAILDGLGGRTLPQLASLVGRIVAHDAAFRFSGQPVQLEIAEPGVADDIVLSILDNDGKTVAETPVPAGTTRFDWDGRIANGSYARPGLYTGELRHLDDGDRVDLQVLTQAEIEEVRFEATGTKMLLADGSVISEEQIRVLR